MKSKNPLDITYKQIIENLEHTNYPMLITGVNRAVPNSKTTHIYEGTFHDVGDGLCRYAPDSLYRNNSTGNFCKICLRKAKKIIENL